jgi:hypothetical protein
MAMAWKERMLGKLDKHVGGYHPLELTKHGGKLLQHAVFACRLAFLI